jgi:hypothetical protein
VNGVVHDLGYQRYAGARRPQATRWQVILRNQVATGWSTWWRFKAWLAVAAVMTVAVCAFIYVWQAKITPVFRAGEQLRVIDGMLPVALDWIRRIGFLVSLTVGAAAIASDSISGAFTFYFSRPVRPIDYLAGKLGGLIVLQAIIQVVPAVLIALFRIGLSATPSEVVGELVLVPQMLGLGLLGAVVYAAVPLAISALVPHRRNAVLVWVAYHVMIGGIASLIGTVTGAPVGAIDLALSQLSITQAVMGVDAPVFFGSERAVPPVGWAIASVAIQVGGALAIAYRQIRAAQQAGIGGGS